MKRETIQWLLVWTLVGKLADQLIANQLSCSCPGGINLDVFEMMRSSGAGKLGINR